MKLIVLLLLTLGCSKIIQTEEGSVKLDRSYKKYVHSEKFIKSEVVSSSESCTYCGICFGFDGKIKTSCLCVGSRSTKDVYNTLRVIYEYRSKKEIQRYKTIPYKVKKHVKNINKGSCS